MLFLVGVALFSKNKTKPNAELNTALNTSEKVVSRPIENNSGAQNLVITSPTLDNSKSDPCLELKNENSPYATLDRLKAKEKINSRFENVHKRLDGKVFRLRRFYKEGQEGEKPKFLVFEEDKNEEGVLKESSDYKPGNLYQKILEANAEVIYSEEGVQTANGLFLHYIDGKLHALQGTIKNKNLDCVMNP